MQSKTGKMFWDTGNMNFIKELIEANKEMIADFFSIILFLLGLAAIVGILNNLF